MNTREIFDEILKHTYGNLKNLEALKLNCKKNEVLVSSVTEDMGIIVNGTIRDKLTNNPTVFGCQRLDILNSCLSFDLFSPKENGTLDIKYHDEMPWSLVFGSEYGHSAEYRLTTEAIIEKRVAVDHLGDMDWSVNTEVHQILYEQFRRVSTSFAKSNKNKFSIKSKNDGYLYFTVGGQGADSMEFPVLQSDVKWNSSFKWSIDNFNAIMRICTDYEKVNIRISEQNGLICLEPVSDSKETSWQYYMQALKSND